MCTSVHIFLLLYLHKYVLDWINNTYTYMHINICIFSSRNIFKLSFMSVLFICRSVCSVLSSVSFYSHTFMSVPMFILIVLLFLCVSMCIIVCMSVFVYIWKYMCVRFCKCAFFVFLCAYLCLCDNIWVFRYLFICVYTDVYECVWMCLFLCVFSVCARGCVYVKVFVSWCFYESIWFCGCL